MLVYEKNNKLNINFENDLGSPDIEIGKSEIKVDGNNIVSGGGAGGAFVVHATRVYESPNFVFTVDETIDEIVSGIEGSGNAYMIVDQPYGDEHYYSYFTMTNYSNNNNNPDITFRVPPFLSQYDSSGAELRQQTIDYSGGNWSFKDIHCTFSATW